MKKKKRKPITEEFIHIDETRLDEEWVNQPGLRFKYGRKLADARERMDEAKADLDITKAELDRDIRSDPEEYGVERISEAAIANAVQLQEEFHKANAVFRIRRHDVAIYEAAVFAIDHRKRALEKLVELFMADYFATPRSPKGSGEVMDEVVKQEVRRPKKRRRK